ncbi:hypothetical protein [Adhaeribacter pallidiroseus]|uniref:Uncharacterized protein n=1 Tax=Adhaeribacter pallidiroseus TaxID=2072847 RepID=A0A369QMR5_9BACT|nr:hypothetical protein [Adhaeribacter pallidiroseus]RDC64139.1 hypothetical protein AHMF7616_02750 [Adhaeribacter pallidiroseus]
MDDYFEIPVTYKKEEHDFRIRLIMTDYTHQFEVDEDQSCGALVDEATLQRNPKLAKALLQVIAEILDQCKDIVV